MAIAAQQSSSRPATERASQEQEPWHPTNRLELTLNKHTSLHFNMACLKLVYRVFLRIYSVMTDECVFYFKKCVLRWKNPLILSEFAVFWCLVIVVI